MATKISDINVGYEIQQDKLPISVEMIAERFYGIEMIHYFNNGLVAIGTKNLGTISVDKLLRIQKELGAKSMTISMMQIYSEGLMYVLNYLVD
jgi:hypothetical protein